MYRMSNEYVRLVHLFVKPDLRDEIKIIKKEKTYDEFLRNLIKKNDSSVTSKSLDSYDQSGKKGYTNVS